MGYTILEQTGRFLAQLLTKPSPGYEPFAPIPVERLLGVLEPGDIILVEGHQYVSSAIKYLTMSTWSHAAMYVGEIEGAEEAEPVDLDALPLHVGIVELRGALCLHPGHRCSAVE